MSLWDWSQLKFHLTALRHVIITPKVNFRHHSRAVNNSHVISHVNKIETFMSAWPDLRRNMNESDWLVTTVKLLFMYSGISLVCWKNCPHMLGTITGSGPVKNDTFSIPHVQEDNLALPVTIALKSYGPVIFGDIILWKRFSVFHRMVCLGHNIKLWVADGNGKCLCLFLYMTIHL